MADISDLRHEEGVRLDADRLVALYAKLGEAEAERVICAAMEALAVQLSVVQRAAAEGAQDTLVQGLLKLAGLAAQVGMTSLARVAGDVVGCAMTGDGPAQAATLARLVRIGDRSLTEVWDLQDVSL
ncbi:hypothetical protein CCR83_12165 [Rhodobacter veldkampii DSM 11550]|uniref:HPt domain-containing protein n=1 Tax=Phaeovulum veldkampii DSM 11550 TaxID=1185920 RepID=A0A2T4JIE6_9RHOB|nr:hypothetical protein [Phaeovulum veldkampii]MBK5947173.1 hypothetical protein [Phaeovulum veldkampii DSM 11550]PTE17633.1 hypothetical protein C5F46_08160 [Phaeovulum veldkampii DSM 11550]TDQ57544.1 hypothetical protein EV658_11290 [Phaeovulum veldkampii DSM 11550]